MDFKVILERKDAEGKFAFVTVSDCADMDECLEHLGKEFPEYQLETITPVQERQV